MRFESPTLLALQKALDAGSLRQRVIANNIANINTPGFKKSSVEFQILFETALNRPLPLAKTDPRHLSARGAGLEPRVITHNNTSIRADGNNVDIEEEMISQAANMLAYQTTAQLVSGKYASLERVIRGRSG